MRQAPDGGKEGGSQPTDSSVINRRVFLAPALPVDKGKNRRQMEKKFPPTLDIGSHINAGPQLLQAGVRPYAADDKLWELPFLRCLGWDTLLAYTTPLGAMRDRTTDRINDIVRDE